MVFVGRERELELLTAELGAVTGTTGHAGRCVLLRGRRRVGKSRLVERFIERARVPSMFYSATGVPVERELLRFAEHARTSDLPGRDVFTDLTVQTWDAALRTLANALPDDQPSVVVIDEVPYLVANDPGFEGTLQSAWDRLLSRKPVLLILVGSDLSMMEALNTYGRPFHQRGTPMVLDPLNPAEVATMLDLSAVDAFDAYLVTGGLPLLCSEWPHGASVDRYLRGALARPTSALVVSAELTLAAEFPADAHERLVLSAIGSGHRARATIGRAAGNMANASLDRALNLLTDKRIVAADRPLSTRTSRETRYRVTDPYLKFWLSFIEPHLDELDRGRADRVSQRIKDGWMRWRGMAIEPIIRESLRRLRWQEPGLDAPVVGGYWTRNNDVELDLVGADRSPVARRIIYTGSIKWLDQAPFDHHHLAELITHRNHLPGADADTPLVIVSRTGTVVGDAVQAVISPEQLLEAWRN